MSSFQSSVSSSRFYWVLLFLWCALIFFLSSQQRLPGPENVSFDFLIKKTGHVSVYAVLFWLSYTAFSKENFTRPSLYAFLFGIAYALSDEFHQSFVPGRTPMLRDVVIDIFGMIVSFGAIRFSKKGR